MDGTIWAHGIQGSHRAHGTHGMHGTYGSCETHGPHGPQALMGTSVPLSKAGGPMGRRAGRRISRQTSGLENPLKCQNQKDAQHHSLQKVVLNSSPPFF